MDGKTYQITKETCQKMIDDRGNVCDYCGRDIVPIETVDNAKQPTYWPGCMHGGECGHYTASVPKDVFDLAEKLVCDGEQTRYLNKPDYGKTPEGRLFWFQENVSSMCSRIRQIDALKTNPPRKTKEQFLADEYW